MCSSWACNPSSMGAGWSTELQVSLETQWRPCHKQRKKNIPKHGDLSRCAGVVWVTRVWIVSKGDLSSQEMFILWPPHILSSPFSHKFSILTKDQTLTGSHFKTVTYNIISDISSHIKHMVFAHHQPILYHLTGFSIQLWYHPELTDPVRSGLSSPHCPHCRCQSQACDFIIG
jgi:hypothetical protein